MDDAKKINAHDPKAAALLPYHSPLAKLLPNESITQEDIDVFLSNTGATADTISIFSFNVSGAANAADSVAALLCLLRQLEARPYLHYFDFPLSAARERDRKGLSIPSFLVYLQEQGKYASATDAPLLLRGVSASALFSVERGRRQIEAARAVPGNAAADMMDLFGGMQTFPAVSAASSIPASTQRAVSSTNETASIDPFAACSTGDPRASEADKDVAGRAVQLTEPVYSDLRGLSSVDDI
jgi:hypothetical protein